VCSAPSQDEAFVMNEQQQSCPAFTTTAVLVCCLG
jgi:hypothetical protein